MLVDFLVVVGPLLVKVVQGPRVLPELLMALEDWKFYLVVREVEWGIWVMLALEEEQ